MSFKIHDKSDKAYIILGAPHSATSFMSKALIDSGVKIKINETMHYESQTVNWLNDEILKEAGGKWYRPPPEEEILKVTKYDPKIKQIIKDAKDKFWGLKDPRMSLTGKKWLPYIKGDVYLVCLFRKPERVKRSWRKSTYPLDKNNVTDLYNESIISIIREFCEL